MTQLPAPQELEQFRHRIRQYFRRHGRSMPWRETEDPYLVTVSEFMLQQTQVSRVARAFPAFIGRFPTWRAVAEARAAEVVQQWQGLGYNRRALYLHRSAIEVCNRFDGELPRDQQALATLPGIGWNTAGAVCAFAFSMPVVFIETNIRRVFLHWFFADRSGISDRQLLPFVEAALDHHDPRRWYWALMDYGAMLKEALPNPNRRSAHYSRQSPFAGSRRQVRGAILRLLADGGVLAADEIAAAVTESLPMEPNAHSIESILSELEREGFLVAEQQRYALR